jgi:hypothetical protein
MLIRHSRFAKVISAALLVLLTISANPPAKAASGTVGIGNCQSTVGDTTYFTASTTGNYCLLTFKASASTSTITATWTVPAGVQTVQVLIVGGGGGGGSDIGGGGGAGRLIETTTTVTPGTTPTLTAGKGGASGTGTYSTPSGTDHTGGFTGTSSALGTITALGGSGAIGRTKSSGTASGWDFNGWTGGGAGVYVGSVTPGVGGSGFQGGIGGSLGGGGGGGAGGGGSAGSGNGGTGGAGVTTSFIGTPTCYGGGGGGGTNGTVGSATCGGQSGTSGNPTPSAATPGFGGGGGGGGGSGSPNGGQGGSGTVIIKWLPGQSISFTQLADQNKNSASTAMLAATSTSSLTVTFSTSTAGVCTISATTVTFISQGTCTVVASQSGNSSYQAAVDVAMSFTIGGDLTLTITASTPFIYRTNETIVVNSSGIAGKATFKQGKVRIPGCISVPLSAGNSYSFTCTWKPSTNGAATFSVVVVPTSNTYSTTTKSLTATVGRRTNNR